MDDKTRRRLGIAAAGIRMGAIEAVHSARSGHPGGSLSIADLLAYLYFKEMRINSAESHWEERDRLVLSKGHCTPALYSALALRNFFPYDELKKFRQIDSWLQGHPDMKHVPGVDMSTGSLGQGISAACGMAKAAKLKNESYNVFAILGDGELEEGEVWEAAMFAAHYKLDNLCVFVDNNNLQIDGEISKVMSPYPITDKFKAFGFNVVEINGHDFDELESAVENFKKTSEMPTCVVMKTVKGKGVSFMENNPSWHGSAPNDDEYKTALLEIRAQAAELRGAVNG